MHSLKLPDASGRPQEYRLTGKPGFSTGKGEFKSRVLFSAAHVVADPLADNAPGAKASLDWEATLAYRHYLWSLGLGVADAMDTAQRGMGLDWPVAQELIRRSGEEARAANGRLAVGVNTDHLGPAADRQCSLDEIRQAYCRQCEIAEASGAQIILMASRHLARAASGPEDYAAVYDHVLSQVSRPVIIHWLGEMFDPALAGYWGGDAFAATMETCLGIISAHAHKVDGIKLSLLDKDKEITLRSRLPDGVRMYTGDDFNYPELIEGDGTRYSDALLGIFDPIAPAASAALQALDQGDVARYREILEPTQTLSRHIFQSPTYFYKTGVVFMAYLNGHQGHFRMVGGQESARSIPHLCELFRLADKADLLRDPELAVSRMQRVLAVAGIE